MLQVAWNLQEMLQLKDDNVATTSKQKWKAIYVSLTTWESI